MTGDILTPIAPTGWAILLVLVLAAPLVGSFLGVLVRRLPAGLPIAVDRSRCESCGTTLGIVELVPIVSFLIQRGRCRHCRSAIDRHHLWIEFAAILVPLWSAAAGDDQARLVAGCVLGWTLLALAWIDAGTMLLPDALTLPLILAGLFWCVWAEPEALADRAGGAVLGYAAFRLIAMAYRRLRGRDGLGIGDAKLLAAAGAWIGAGQLGLVVLVAALAGLALAGAIRFSGRALGAASAIPFGPCLALGLWLVWLYSPGS